MLFSQQSPSATHGSLRISKRDGEYGTFCFISRTSRISSRIFPNRRTIPVLGQAWLIVDVAEKLHGRIEEQAAGANVAVACDGGDVTGEKASAVLLLERGRDGISILRRRAEAPREAAGARDGSGPSAPGAPAAVLPRIWAGSLRGGGAGGPGGPESGCRWSERPDSLPPPRRPTGADPGPWPAGRA